MKMKGGKGAVVRCCRVVRRAGTDDDASDGARGRGAREREEKMTTSTARGARGTAAGATTGRPTRSRLGATLQRF